MAFEYLFAALPSLPSGPGGRVGMPARELAAMCSAESGDAPLLSRALLVEFDIRAMERMAIGVDPGETALHTEEEIRAGQGLPAWLEGALADARSADGGDYRFDRVWRAHFANMFSLAEESGSGFLMRWACFDAGLRSAVAAHRSSARKEAARGCDIAGSCGDPCDYRRVIDEMIDIQERGDGSWKALDRFVASARLARAGEMSAPYSFDLDELLSYVVRFTVLKHCQYLA
ncbi:MAG: hypothetical protein JXA24_01160 [Proteobacteria bacterium]|nr:hypothetical protein [Pseudomonadota bacterium]